MNNKTLFEKRLRVAEIASWVCKTCLESAVQLGLVYLLIRLVDFKATDFLMATCILVALGCVAKLVSEQATWLASREV